MAHTTKSELEARFGIDEIADLEEGNDIYAAISDAGGLIDGYLAAKYTLPLAYSPSILVGVASDIARYKLWDERAPEEVRKRYEDALALLKDIARGLISLPPDAKGAAPTSSGGIEYFSQSRVFDEDSLADY